MTKDLRNVVAGRRLLPGRKALWSMRNQGERPFTKAEREFLYRERRARGLAVGLIEYDEMLLVQAMRSAGAWDKDRPPNAHEQAAALRGLVDGFASEVVKIGASTASRRYRHVWRGRRKKQPKNQINFRATTRTRQLIKDLADHHNATQTDIISSAIKNLAAKLVIGGRK